MDENKTLITEYLRAVSGHTKKPELVAKYVADPKLAAHIAEVEAAFPNYELIADEMLGERDRVVVRGTFRGVHQGVFANVAPTGKSVAAGLIIIYRIENHRIAEHWMQFDLFSLLQQLQGSPAMVSG
jgi:predicted ester cyclase